MKMLGRGEMSNDTVGEFVVRNCHPDSAVTESQVVQMDATQYVNSPTVSIATHGRYLAQRPVWPVILQPVSRRIAVPTR